jgi:hypothetical protein
VTSPPSIPSGVAGVSIGPPGDIGFIPDFWRLAATLIRCGSRAVDPVVEHYDEFVVVVLAVGRVLDVNGPYMPRSSWPPGNGGLRQHRHAVHVVRDRQPVPVVSCGRSFFTHERRLPDFWSRISLAGTLPV